jgi:DNA-binding NarL/FixJ family response regulator
VIRVVVADDQTLVRRGFASILDSIDDIEVVGEASNGVEALALVERTRPDVILMDIRMPQMDGLDATARITNDPDLAGTRILILTTFDLDEYVQQALIAGASGFLLKDTEPDELIQAVRVVARGDALLAPAITRRLIEEYVQRARPPVTDLITLDRLTQREREVLEHVARGHSNSEIATNLYVSGATIKTHVAHLLMKLHARDRTQLVVVAYETGLVRPAN